MDHHKLAADLLSRPSFEVVAWVDPRCDGGLPADSDEALMLLCPVLGPSATIILHRLARYASVGRTEWEPEPFAATFGLSTATLAPRALSRLSRFGMGEIGATQLAVRTTVPHIPLHWLERLPEYLRNDLPLAA
ncbi:MAG: hypothetical protein ACLGHQ_15130 [Acidimicrobiia bacterium]